MVPSALVQSQVAFKVGQCRGEPWLIKLLRKWDRSWPEKEKNVVREIIAFFQKQTIELSEEEMRMVRAAKNKKKM